MKYSMFEIFTCPTDTKHSYNYKEHYLSYRTTETNLITHSHSKLIDKLFFTFKFVSIFLEMIFLFVD